MRFLHAAVCCAAASGCRSWSVWPFRSALSPTPHETAAPAASDVFPATSASASASSGDAVRVVNLAFDVRRVEMPIDGVRNSPKVWNHVDELRLDPDLVARLARNGLRVGVASSGSWSAIRTILEAGRARTQKDQMLPQPGTPLILELAAIQESESIFSYGRDNRLVGKTFPAGQKTIQFDYAFHPQLGGCTDLEIGFEVRNERGEMTWERRGGEIRQVPAYDRHVYEDLRAALTLKPGEFLVIGPSGQADNEYLIGSRFLMHTMSGQRSETLLFVTPQPFQSQSAHRPP